MATKTVKKTIAKSGGSGKTPAPLAPRSSNRPIRVPKTAEIVSDSIRQRIISGELQEGDSLPPESQLMEDFSISRPTLREAFRILEAEQLISVVRGSRTGARVHLPHVESVSRYASHILRGNWRAHNQRKKLSVCAPKRTGLVHWLRRKNFLNSWSVWRNSIVSWSNRAETKRCISSHASCRM